MSITTLSALDQFCGAGGSSLGASNAGWEITAAVNHSDRAIETHAKNFPRTRHYLTDVQNADPRRFPTTRMLITSPSCTNHSLAKGAKRRNLAQLGMFEDNQGSAVEERSRATMWDVVRFAEYHQYDLVIVENVPDARLWSLWDSWWHAMTVGLGYTGECVYFNSQFAHPTPQSRDRMYMIFWKKTMRRPNLDFFPRAYCPKCGRDVDSVQSWRNPQKRWGKYRQQYDYCCPTCSLVVRPYYYAAANCIDWSNVGERIGDRKKPLAAKTISRIEAGLKKFAGRGYPAGLAAFLSEQWGGSDHNHQASEPLSTVVASSVHHALVQPFLAQLRFHNEARGVDEPVATLTTGDNQYLVQPPPFLFQSRYPAMISSYYNGSTVNHDTNEPLQTVTGTDRHALVMPPMIVAYYSRADATTPASDPLPTVTTAPRFGLVRFPFLTSYNQGDNRNYSPSEPLPTVTTGNLPRQALVTPPFFTDFHGSGTSFGPSDPLNTVTTGFVAPFAMISPPFLSGYNDGDRNQPLSDPMPTQTTGYSRPVLVQPGEQVRVEDCYFRMLEPAEIQRAMAFDDSYQITGNKKERIHQLGNAVTPPVMQMLAERCSEIL